MRDVIPMIKIEDKWLGIEKFDWALFVGVEAFITLLQNIFLPKSLLLLLLALVVFVAFEWVKHSLEKKEQSLFHVLAQAARIPNSVIGVFYRKDIIKK